MSCLVCRVHLNLPHPSYCCSFRQLITVVLHITFSQLAILEGLIITLNLKKGGGRDANEVCSLEDADLGPRP